MPDDSAMMLAAGSVADAALSGLLQPRKTLPAKLFYDEEGCRLFGRITELPEYYLTRTELALLAEVAPSRGRHGARAGGAGGIRRERRDEGGVPAARRRRRSGVPRLCADRRGGAAARADARAAASAAAGSAGVRRAGRLHGYGGAADRGSVVAAAWFLSRIDDRQSRSAGGAAFPGARARRAWGASRGSWWASICARTRRSCCRRTTMRRASPRRSIATCWCGSIARPAPISIWMPSRIARSGTTKRAGSRCTWSVCASRSCASPARRSASRAARRSTPRTATSMRRSNSPHWPSRPDGTARSCGPIRRGCSHCICWSRGRTTDRLRCRRLALAVHVQRVRSRSPVRNARNCNRARCTRLFNVPIAQPVTSAASSYDCSCSTIICSASR